jgi:UDP-GlcNAc:undecaprenyl-phosphate GlcNAc-1-phosphate transferase
MELFIEKSAMISEHFHPLIGLYHRIVHRIKSIRQ